ncbi:MAG: SpoIID/LytB domain-containing protein [Armatimonadetes bacterium]|jgi:stage II sporulation protein D|nr:SpoIID/LytB domain-containing protein [Armatimonadota bacterium]
MNLYFSAFALVMVILLSGSGASASASNGTAKSSDDALDQPLRIGLLRYLKGVKEITLQAGSDYDVMRNGSEDPLAACAKLEPVTISFCEKQLLIKLANGKNCRVDGVVTVQSSDDKAIFTVSSAGRTRRKYRGAIEVSAQNGTLHVVNVVKMDDYLPGVLAGEMPSDFHIEALKTQAVAARSYTIRQRRRHNDDGFDLCDNVHCHVYEGTIGERPAYLSAIAATAGQTLMHNGQVASIMYSADCGGVTESYADVDKHAVPYLICVTEPTGIAHKLWEKSFTLKELSAILVAAGVKQAKGLKSLSIERKTTSGRAAMVRVIGADGTTTVGGNTLRWAIGGTTIPSTLFTIDVSDEGMVTFKGKGFGHGIGMCQIGANALAKPPFNYTYDQILQHYYPTTTLANACDTDTLAASPLPDSGTTSN